MLLNFYIQFTSLFDDQRTLHNPAFNAWYDHETYGIPIWSAVSAPTLRPCHRNLL